MDWGQMQSLTRECLVSEWEALVASVVSDSLRSYGLQPSRLLRPWDFLGKNTGVGCHLLLQGIFLTQGSNTGLLHCRQILHSLSHHRKTDLKPVPLSTIHMTFGKCSIHFIPPSIQLFTCYHKSWLYMWTSPDGQYQNQTDYILCCWRWRSSIQSAKIRPGADCGSLHELLNAKYRLKLKKVGKPLGHSSIISGNGK